MIRSYIILSVLLIITAAPLLAADSYIIVVDGINGSNQNRLEGYPNRAYTKMSDRVYLYGYDDDLQWLDKRSVKYRATPITGEPSSLYLCYGTLESDITGSIFDIGRDYILSDRPVADHFCRKIKTDRLPFSESSANLITDTYDYHPTVAALIDGVEEDSLMDFLSRLSGELPIEIDGQTDTIHTRYSGTEDNEMAARYIRQTLESYGYDVEYHGFYSGELRKISAYDENQVWIVENSGKAYRTVDGENWHLMDIGFETDWWGVENSGPDSVWISGMFGNLYFSDDGGDSWEAQSSGTSNYLFGIQFVDAQEGWVAGDYGLILHTTNGGQNWTVQNTPTSDRLYDVFFLDSECGWAVGRQGTIVHTTNGGQTWTSQNISSSQRLYGICFTDSQHGWVTGWGGLVKYTTNGGSSWQDVDLGDYSEKYAVQFTNTNHGCIAGWDGKIYVTFDAGTTWETATTNTTDNLYALEFCSDTRGYAAGDDALLYTHDGGLNWYEISSGMEDAWRNVIGTKLGTTLFEEQVIICGHFDNISQTPEIRATGADDNGSGTMAVLEAARLYANTNFERTIKFCLWTGEEQGLTGSAAYAADAYRNGDIIMGVYNYDMIAYDGNADYIGELHCGTMSTSHAIGDLLVDVIDDYSILLNPEYITIGSTNRSDHASFWDYNYGAILGIEDFG